MMVATHFRRRCRSLIKLQRREFFPHSDTDHQPAEMPHIRSPDRQTGISAARYQPGWAVLQSLQRRAAICRYWTNITTAAWTYHCLAPAFFPEIRNTRTERQRNGNSITFIGCQFHDLTGARQNLLQKYITQLQKEQPNRTA